MATRGEVRLQPSYFTSSLYVNVLREDITNLILTFHDSYKADTTRPFTTFKEIWVAQGWKWLHFRVFDLRARDTLLTTTARLFLERIVKSQAPFFRVAALFGLYTFFNTQPSGSSPALHSLSHIPIPFDQYELLLQLPFALASTVAPTPSNPSLAPLQPFVTYCLSNLLQNNAFHIVPASNLAAQNPRELPREMFVEGGLIDGNQPQRKGQYSKRDKVVKARFAVEGLSRLLQKQAPGLGMTATQYDRQKRALLDQIGTDDPILQEASESVAATLRKAHEQESDVEVWTGMDRVEAASKLPGGLLHDLPFPPSSMSGSVYPFTPSSQPSYTQAVGPNAQRRYYQPPAAPAQSNRLSAASFQSSSTQSSRSDYGDFSRGPPSVRSNSSGGSSTRTATAYRPMTPALGDKFSFSADPAAWGADLSRDEPDDVLHNPDSRRNGKDTDHNVFTFRGISNLGCLFILGVGLVTLFAGYPLVSHFQSHSLSFFGAFGVGGTNATGQVPAIPGNFGLIDVATPKEAYTMSSYYSPGSELQLVFSDEFEVDGRSFYPGDDPYWEAVDLNYWQTENLNWYDPAAITTSNGSLQITLSQKETHNLNYQSGMLSTWNKFCFTGGILVAAVNLPGITNVAGLWPAVFKVHGKLRASRLRRQSRWDPYTYDACDVGTAPNQTLNGLPLSSTINGDPSADGALSYLPGQRLSRCTCKGESHPGPVHEDGTFVGRSAPEIDVLEAQITNKVGQVSQSGQWAPFNNEYRWFNTTDNLIIPDPEISALNSYLGGAFQQATSVVTNTNQKCYQLIDSTCFEVFGFEYQPGFDGAYISWISNNQLAWTLNEGGMAADPVAQISERPVPQEPMYIIANLAISENFGTIDFEHLTFPAVMKIDYVRVYQPKDAINIGCDPTDFPTQAYINTYIEAYTNPNFTTWTGDLDEGGFDQPNPKSSFLGQC
ncbi:GH16 domain-containing protein [Mycena chlorophos]|uniref:GH16 domain-containing protein n=1 Tax=Mycena chlorophos TaxID=658473 RepID=A0A8H6T4B1_MYCCL|nr:GH16 domain-containing protein [Mycena chlorophos]